MKKREKKVKEKKTNEKKPMKNRLLIPAVFLGLVLLIAANLIGYRCFGQMGENNKNVYIAIRFLNSGNLEAAASYLDSMNGVASKKTRFASDAARILEEKLSGNEILARIKLDLLDREYARNEEQEQVFTYLSEKNIAAGDDISSICTVLTALMRISDKKAEKYEAQYQIQYNSLSGGWVSDEELAEYETLCGKDSADSLRISAALASEDYGTALDTAARMVKKSPSDKNRLLLADIVAQASYSGYAIPGRLFYPELEGELPEEKELKSLEKKIDKLEKQQEKLQARYDMAGSEKEQQKIGAEKVELYEEQEELIRKHDNIYAYRALNSVADIPSLDAKIIRAKIYYAVGEEEKAVQELLNAADSLSAKLSMNEVKQEGLKLVKEAYAGTMDTAVAYHEATKAMLTSLLGSSTSGVLTMNSSGLAQDFSNRLVADIKYQNNGIYISGFDDTAYPEIRMTVNAREEIVNDIVNHNNIKARDTHHDIEYTAQAQPDNHSSICFVVDISGSMDGAPIRNAKNALKNFAKTLDPGTESALVAFDDSADTRAEVTADTSMLLNAVDGLNALGGTNITTGIEEGIHALEAAHFTKCMILMTDGQSDIDYGVVDQAALEGIVIFTIGFGGVNEQMLEEIAQRTGGQFTLADSSGELSSVYNSIGSMLGNQVDLTYTVKEELDAAPRYFFIKAGNFQSSERHPYRTGAEANGGSLADDFYIQEVDGAIPLSKMQEYERNREQWPLRFRTSCDSKVTGVTIGKEQSEAVLDNGWMQTMRNPIAQAGLYDMEITLADNSVYMMEDAVLVYDDVTEGAVSYNGAYRLGVLYIETRLTAFLPDGTVVMNGATFNDGNDPREGNLNAYTLSLVVFPEVTGTLAPDENGEISLGTSGSFYMNGSCYLGADDAQAVHRETTLCSYGRVKAQVDSEQCTIKREEE